MVCPSCLLDSRIAENTACISGTHVLPIFSSPRNSFLCMVAAGQVLTNIVNPDNNYGVVMYLYVRTRSLFLTK